MNMENLKEELLNEWMKENPPFDNDKQTFEDWLVLQLKGKQKEIESLHGSLLATLLEAEILREQKKTLYSEDEILATINLFYTDAAPKQHIEGNIIEDLKRMVKRNEIE